MIDELMEIGDEVVITIEQESREWGYHPCPDGAKATILSFSEIHYGRLGNLGFKPGVYVNRVWVKLRMGDGTKHTEWSGRLELANKIEYDQRLAAFRRKQHEQPDNWRRKEFLRELPETPLWEGDRVRVPRCAGVASQCNPPGVFTIIGIDYHHLTEKTMAGTKWPAYNISDKLGAGWHTAASENDMQLVERGLVWKFYHDEPISFSTVQEEANFFDAIGYTDEVRNPANGLFKWTKDEVLDAIRQGIVHGFTVSSGFFGGGPSISAKRYRDEEVGKRVAQATLEGFGLVAA